MLAWSWRVEMQVLSQGLLSSRRKSRHEYQISRSSIMVLRSPYTRISSSSEATSSYLSTIQSQQLADANPFSLFDYPFGHMKINVNGESVRNAAAVGDHAFSHMDQLFGPESRSIYK
ncbi:hypothetical protein O6H91_Y066200 [Diphasiastrum complanatum]|nr:hypothetical protein O6H91_Y066200 [Diphasiastrum complanatum]